MGSIFNRLGASFWSVFFLHSSATLTSELRGVVPEYTMRNVLGLRFRWRVLCCQERSTSSLGGGGRQRNNNCWLMFPPPLSTADLHLLGENLPSHGARREESAFLGWFGPRVVFPTISASKVGGTHRSVAELSLCHFGGFLSQGGGGEG